MNSEPELKQSYGVSDTTQFCCGPCKSDPIISKFSVKKSTCKAYLSIPFVEIKVWTPYQIKILDQNGPNLAKNLYLVFNYLLKYLTFSLNSFFKVGFVPGEAIQFNANIENKSSRDIKEMDVSIVQNIRLYSTSKSKTFTKTIANIKHPKLVSGKSVEDWNNGLHVPAVCSSSNGGCNIIELSYSLVFKFVPTGIAAKPHLKIPIVVGTIPIRDVEKNSMKISYEQSPFKSSSIKSTQEFKGEMVKNDSDSYKPFYPFYL